MTKAYTVRLPRNLAERLDLHLGEHGYMNASDFLREAVREKLLRHHPKEEDNNPAFR